jgi:hypothetical protein
VIGRRNAGHYSVKKAKDCANRSNKGINVTDPVCPHQLAKCSSGRVQYFQ